MSNNKPLSQTGIEAQQQWRQDFEQQYQVRTDLALEAHDVVLERNGPDMPGVEMQQGESDWARISRVTVANETGARLLGKAPGHYSTIDAPVLKQHNREAQEQVSQVLAGELEWLFAKHGLAEDASVLVIGLGNWQATPDALGPRVIRELMVTRHLHQMTPPELRGQLRPVAALSPGVLGLTGIETGEIILGVCERIQADMVVCVDALASRSTERLLTTIQLSDTGIAPGAGIGNRRVAINQETLGVPVAAIGTPTVVHAGTIVSDAVERIQQERNGTKPNGEPNQQHMTVDPAAIRAPSAADHQPGQNFGLTRAEIEQRLGPEFASLIVTPKEIDAYIDDVSAVVAGGLNTVFHAGVDFDEVFQYLG